MTEFYEHVSLYHPDRLCDYLVSCLLDYCIKKDKFIDYRVECILQDDLLIFVGNINSNYEFSDQELEEELSKVLNDLNLNYVYHFNVLIKKEKLKERPLTGTGIYYGLATCEDFELPSNYILSKEFSNSLEILFGKNYYKSSYVFTNNELVIDVTFTSKNIKEDNFKHIFEDLQISYEINIHYKNYSKLLGITGRKLSIDYYNGLIPNNGGSPWGKDPFNADLTLNKYANQLAIDFRKNNNFEYVMSKLIYLGDNKAILEFYDELNKPISKSEKIEIKPDLYKKLGLNKQIYAKMCKKGFIFQ